MRGFPQTIGSRKDIENLYSLYPEETRTYLQRLLDNRYIWSRTGPIAEGSAGIQDATHRVMRTESGLEQFELVEDANAKIFRLGFTVSELEEMLKNE